MIPKTIHYCWFGRGDMPELAQMCIDSWKKHLPDYEIKLWNEDNFDININHYVKEAYEAKKYAFVSDYARFYILYNNGGVYMDTDVEVLKPIDNLLTNNAFMGFEDEKNVNPGLIIGSKKGHPLLKEMIDSYSNRKFILNDGSYNLTTVVKYTTNILLSHGLVLNNSKQNVKGMVIYPKTYFCPLDADSTRKDLTDLTHTIHHFSASWLTEEEKIRGKRNAQIKNIISKIIGEKGFDTLLKLRNNILKKN